MWSKNNNELIVFKMNRLQNKLDLLSNKQKEDLKENFHRKLRFAEFLETKFISAKDGRGVNALIKLAEKAYLSSVKDLQIYILI